jgi:radical SAM superfamily enzyme YgiQ (UPF0313 family)
MYPTILLVNPPVYDFAAYDFWLKPYGLLTVAGYLRGKADFAIFDYLDRLHPFAAKQEQVQSDRWARGRFYSRRIPTPSPLASIPRYFRRFGLPRDVFADYLARTEPPDYVLIQTTMTYWYPGVEEVIRDIRSIHPSAKIILGGNYVTLCPSHAETLGADLLIPGTNLQPLWDYLGITPDLRQPALWEVYPKLSVGALKLTDGCPFKCTYCAVPKVYGQFSARPLDRSLAEIKLLIRLGAKNIAFYDDALLFKPEKALAPFLTEIITQHNIQHPTSETTSPKRKRRGIPPIRDGWQPQAKLGDGHNAIRNTRYTIRNTHPDIRPTTSDIRNTNLHSPNALNARFLTKDLAELMVRAGFKTFYLGFESASAQWQKCTGSKVFCEELASAVAYLKAAGADPADITAYQILGHPYSDIQQLEDSMRFVNSLGIRGTLADFSPIPGTPDGDCCAKYVDLAEPLNHNKTAFPITLLGFDQSNRLKDLQRNLNRNILDRPALI